MKTKKNNSSKNLISGSVRVEMNFKHARIFSPRTKMVRRMNFRCRQNLFVGLGNFDQNWLFLILCTFWGTPIFQGVKSVTFRLPFFHSTNTLKALFFGAVLELLFSIVFFSLICTLFSDEMFNISFSPEKKRNFFLMPSNTFFSLSKNFYSTWKQREPRRTIRFDFTMFSRLFF